MSLRALVALPLILAACGLRPYDFGDSATDTTGDMTTTSTTAASGPVTGAAESDGGTTGCDDPTTIGNTTQSFITSHDFGEFGKQCDQWVQDCPEGQKCMPYSGDGDNAWESLKCVDIVPDPDGLYEPCSVFGSHVSGEDSCDKGLMCWDVLDGVGRCVAMCTGRPDAPDCADSGAVCILHADAVLTLCLPRCQPLLEDCEDCQVCWPQQGTFICVHDVSGDEGQAFDVCEYANACDPGLLCLNPTLADECDPQAIGCCLPFCDTSLPNTCPGAGQECLAWYEPVQAPAGYEDVGVCGLPMP